MGEEQRNLNVYAARRGNWEVMVRGLFENNDVRNALSTEVGSTLHQPSGKEMPIWAAAKLYQSEDVSTVLIAGERYGAGSSRDWAAKGLSILGIRAVVARSFERIHRTNLIGMGILPIRLPMQTTEREIQVETGDQLEVDARELSPRGRISLAMVRKDGRRRAIAGSAAIETSMEIDILRAGGMISFILRKVQCGR